MSDELLHYGTPRHSGRYPYGSGERPYQGTIDFYGTANKLKKDGLTEKEIADYFDISVKQYRAKYSNAKNEKKAADYAQAVRLKDKGYSDSAIAERLGYPGESSVRSMMASYRKGTTTKTENTAKGLVEALEKQSYLDVSGGVENWLGVTRNTLDNAVEMLKDKGYTVSWVQTIQLGTGKKTSIKVLAKPGTDHKDIYANRDQIEMPGFKSEDQGRTTVSTRKPPVSISSDRIKVNYREDGGIDKDGVIELRRGVDDISLGAARYAQVRIAVDGTHYLKGMAMYSDDMPDGVDIIFNTNKSKGTPVKGEKDNSVLKPMKKEQDNPFGANYRNMDFIGKDGKSHQSAVNIVNEEGDWNRWRKTLSSQMLSKQSPMLAKRQLDLAYDLKKDEFDEIMSLTNPVIKRQLLNKMADGCDSAAVHLKAAGLPRQASKVILPFPDMKENEIYAPSFRQGEQVALIRYPHGGTFEIPTLTVNNKQKTAKSLINNAQDAVGINPRVAERLSGADFDGDTVLVIPTTGVKIKTSDPLPGLKGFDPQTMYKAYPGMPEVKGSGFNKQRQMGDVSNLITDMTIKGATKEELARAVRHSMVIIDAEKHNLNYKQSAIDNGIAQLKEKYQGRKNAGASTLISRASSQAHPIKYKESIDPATGRKIKTTVNETYIDKNGKTVIRRMNSTKMYEAEDARSLISTSNSTIENIYADHANKLKALANRARKEAISVKTPVRNKMASLEYKPQVDSLNAKLNEALKNRPLERKAQLLANAKVKAVRDANPDMDKDDVKKLRNRSLQEARAQTGAAKHDIKITDKEWEAIQAGAISTNKLNQIINNSDLDVLKSFAMPRSFNGMSPAKVNKAKQMLDNGYTLAEVADACGVSVSTLNRAIA